MASSGLNLPLAGISCPIPKNNFDCILLSHGGGGRLTQKLIREVFIPAFNNSQLAQQHDGATFRCTESTMAITTDSFVVDPVFFPGGNIGDLAINGTVNDLVCCGAKPIYLTVGFIIEEGFSIADLQQIVDSMSAAAEKAGVKVVAGDTKVVDRGKCDKIFINTSGVGAVLPHVHISPSSARLGDVVICSGRIAEHGICILSTRESLGFETTISSDTTSLNAMVEDLLSQVNSVKVLRDPTRGGVATTLNEIAESSNVHIELQENSIPIATEVEAACDLLGIDPLYVANEGVMLVIVPQHQANEAVRILRNHPEGVDAQVIGRIVEEGKAIVTLKTQYGGTRIVDMLSGEQLPRIC